MNRLVTIFFAVKNDIVLLYRLLCDHNTSYRIKIIIIGMILYVLSPIDVVSDIIPIFGQIDDVAVIMMTIYWIKTQDKKKKRIDATTRKKKKLLISYKYYHIMKYYVILKGHTTGIFTNRDTCKSQVIGFLGAQYKSFPTLQSAQWAWDTQSFGTKGQSSNDYLRQVMGEDFDRAICTDAACPSNPGPIEWRGVIISTHEDIFSHGPYPGGSVNIAEFLAIVEGLQRLSGQNKYSILYSDSKIAISRTQKGKINTQITKDNSNIILFNKIQESEQRLQDNPTRSSRITLKKRPTSQWDQIPADFGRK